jgi:hypothetical protein
MTDPGHRAAGETAAAGPCRERNLQERSHLRSHPRRKATSRILEVAPDLRRDGRI